jgi:hypothetical protein
MMSEKSAGVVYAAVEEEICRAMNYPGERHG